MDPSLTVLLLGCFQFVQQRRLWGFHAWSRQPASQTLWGSKRQKLASGRGGLAQLGHQTKLVSQILALRNLDFGCNCPRLFDGTWSEGTGGAMWGIICYHVQKSRENPSEDKDREKERDKRVENSREVEKGTEKERQSESSCPNSRWFPVSGSNPCLGPTTLPALGFQKKPLSPSIWHMYRIELILNIWTSLNGFLFLGVQ